MNREVIEQKKVIKPAVLGILAFIPGLVHCLVAAVSVAVAVPVLFGMAAATAGSKAATQASGGFIWVLIVLCSWGVLFAVLLGALAAIVGTVTSFIRTAAKSTKVCGIIVMISAWYNWIVVLFLGVCWALAWDALEIKGVWMVVFGALTALFLTFAGRSLKKASGCYAK